MNCPRMPAGQQHRYGPAEWCDGEWGTRDDQWDRWEWPWQPRQCSLCGGLHPDDGLKLIAEGWEIAPSTKNYKVYLNPPGTAHAVRLRYARMRDASVVAPSVWSPKPPVKVYTQHWSREQVDELEKHIDGSRA